MPYILAQNDTENKRPRSSPAPSTTTSAAARDRRKFDENRGCEAAVGASDEYVSSLVSPAVIADVLSPLMYDSDNRGESTPHVHKTKRPPTSGPKCTGILSCYVSPLSELRHCPMPQLSWADAANVWQQMCRKDDRSLLERSPEMLSRHPGLLPRMRAILVDWLIEVCEVYKLHRETYYLAIDYLDRYLSSHRDVSKTRLQLIGITCLFIAAKMEEIYPPKIGEFAYVTDGACNEEDIQMQELNLLQGLNWHVSPITVIGWLGVYLQVDVNNVNTIPYPVEMNRQNNSRVLAAIANLETPAKSPASASTSAMASESPSFIFPQFSSLDFAQTSQLVDLCSLDVDITRYPYSVIAASAIRHVLDKETALTVSGFDWETISDCCKWMEPFYSVILEDNSSLFLLEQNEQVEQNFGLNSVCPNLIKDDSYKTQTHTISLGMFVSIFY